MGVEKLLREEVTGFGVPGAMKPKYRLEKERRRSDLVMLDKNENPYGFSPQVEKALLESIRYGNLYPDSAMTELSEAIANRYGVGEENVLVGNGSSELIDLLAKAFVAKGDEVIIADFTFFLFGQYVKLMGGKPVLIPLRDWRYDLEAVAAAVTPRTKMIFVCNPNNPTGTIVTAAAVEKFLAQMPPDVIVVLDEAYAEFVTDPAFPQSAGYLGRYPNVVVLRTFSKAYGMAGLRVGYALAGEALINCLKRVVTLFSVNALSQAAAVAALTDQEFVAKSREGNRTEKEYLYRELQSLGFDCVPSETIFILVDLHRSASEVFQALLDRGIYTNIFPPYPQHIRFSVGSRADNERLVAALREIVE